ncbi:ATP-binding protein [Dyadobacter sp. 32]|uniref:ATP-binding protein n=1 Tax=Dyadobacter sp. 32 TaxID=538966 RepID=UPI0011EECD09
MHSTENDEQFLSGGGQMGALIRSMDWSKTALGPISQWPQSLRTSVSLCLSSTFPILIAWGDQLIQIYNDSYRPICGAKHPESMGQNFKICWETALPVVGAAFDRGLAGEGTYIKDQQMLLDRYGYIEEAFMTFSFAPIRDESGNVGGIFHPITETTEQILSSRRTQVLRDLAFQTGNAKTNDEIYQKLYQVQSLFNYDVPFIQVYEVNESAHQAFLKVSSGITDRLMDFAVIELDSEDDKFWPLFQLATDNPQSVQINELRERFGDFKSGPFQQAPHTALIFPILITGNDKASGYLIVGVSSARSLDQQYQNFFELFANTVSTAFSNVDAYQQQQKRAQQLAEIDRAKTAFFSNVSHEFRTPLTLILGPLQQIADNPQLEGRLSQEDRDSMHRNAQRLLKLVNNLLDFSRLEAGRVKASFQCVELGVLTADLTSNFRSVIESAGMELVLDINQQGPDVYVDTEMWEKIVLNLLSNAFKYTLSGSITVGLHFHGGFAVLKVSDTGVGIQKDELPHMFERFHRIENSNGRTHEGTGIGLSLVAELVNLHHGQISVESTFGEGSTFTVKVPLGKDHLPKEQIIPALRQISSSQQETFIREAMSLLEKDDTGHAKHAPVSQALQQQIPDFEIQQDVKVLIVDDNADMRSYLGKLLSPYLSVDFAIHGQDALAKVLSARPDVIISDVMMPVMDGQQLLQQLRVLPGSRIPVILLSARAGEESRVEGLGWGADDYLVKPFSAKELLSKVDSLIKINQLTTKTEAELRSIFMHAPVAIGIFRGPQLVIEVANSMMLRYWGKTSLQVSGLPFDQAFTKSHGDGLEVIVKDVFETGNRRVLSEWPLEVARHGKASKLIVNLALEPLHDLTGLISGVMVVANDVTEMITALELVRESEQRFKMLADTMPQLVWRIDKTGGENFYNDFIHKYSGLSRQELIAKGLIILVHPDEQQPSLVAWEKALQSGEDFMYEHRIRRYDGVYRWHLSRGIAQRSQLGLIENWVGSSTDIHDQKTLEETLESRVSLRTAELEVINQQLVKSNQELEQFAHVTSHDLQEPLRKIQIFSGLVKNRVAESDTATLDYIKKVTSSAERMSNLIRDLLSFAGLRVPNAVFELVDLNTIISLIKEDFEQLIRETNTQIIADALPTLPAVPSQMNQLFYNLIGNAIKFSGENPRLEIHYQSVGFDQGDHSFLKRNTRYAKITFKDYGIGFDQQFTDRIFIIFQRLHSQNDFPGTGIGLSICKRIIENHSGFIRAESQKGLGSSFDVYLPLQ